MVSLDVGIAAVMGQNLESESCRMSERAGNCSFAEDHDFVWWTCVKRYGIDVEMGSGGKCLLAAADDAHGDYFDFVEGTCVRRREVDVRMESAVADDTDDCESGLERASSPNRGLHFQNQPL